MSTSGDEPLLLDDLERGGGHDDDDSGSPRGGESRLTGFSATFDYGSGRASRSTGGRTPIRTGANDAGEQDAIYIPPPQLPGPRRRRLPWPPPELKRERVHVLAGLGALGCVVLVLITVVVFAADDRIRLDDRGGLDPHITVEVKPLVATTSGQLNGTLDSSGTVAMFRGVRYARAPVGTRRWAPPVPEYKEWDDFVDATAYGPVCPQNSSLHPQSEDCLLLNVFTPLDAIDNGASLPVLVYIHGGGFTTGASSYDTFRGETFVKAAFDAGEPVIVVTIQYRIGILGFLDLPEFGDSSSPSSSSTPANFGMLDQQEALKWVKNNIAEFGGHPANVMIFGESAGAMSVCTLLAMPSSTGLFARALLESGTCTLAGMYPDRVEAWTRGAAVVDRLGCSAGVRVTDESGERGSGSKSNGNGERPGDEKASGARAVPDAAGLGDSEEADVAACLRALPTETVLEAAVVGFGDVASPFRLDWSPVIDGVSIPVSPQTAFEAGDFASAAEVVVGTNLNEGTFFVYALMEDAVDSAVVYNATLAAFLGPALFDTVYPFYPFDPEVDGRVGLSKVITDGMFYCDARNVLRLARDGPLASTYGYRFLHTPSWLKFIGEEYLGSYHTAELPFVFGRPPSGAFFVSNELDLSDQMQAYWRSYARTGDPNG